MILAERTVDSMVAIEFARLDPGSIILSPTNTKNSFDHLVGIRGHITILECKGIDDSSHIPIRLKQLRTYVYTTGPRFTLYLLPSRPRADQPWARRCSKSCCRNRGCSYCPRDARSWNGLDSWIRLLRSPMNLQPWFAHWSWCVPAVDLANHCGVSSSTTKGFYNLAWDDAQLGSLPNAVRLCHLFGSRPEGANTRSLARGIPKSEPIELSRIDEMLGRPDYEVMENETLPLLVVQASGSSQ